MYPLKLKKKLATLILLMTASVFADSNDDFAGYTQILKMPEVPLSDFDSFKDVKELNADADIYEYVGDNLIARGHVVIRVKGAMLRADRVIVNLKTQDFEAFGNVAFSNVVSMEKTVDHAQYQKLFNNPDDHVTIKGYTSDPTGLPLLKVSIDHDGSYIRAERVAGNLTTGSFKFKNIGMRSGFMYLLAEEATRRPDGRIDMKKTKLSTCEYIMDEREHYSFTSSHTTLFPRHYNSGLKNYNDDKGEHAIMIYNPVFRLYGVPLIWAPALFKPWETDSFGIDFQFGKTREWGYYFKTSKGFTISDDPYLHFRGMVDWYSERGLGWGASAKLLTGNSRTDLFIYGIRDKDPYRYWNLDNDLQLQQHLATYRMEVPKNRYEFKITNVTHITPRLDFRGQFDKLSDYDFLNSYFRSRYQEGTQPPTYAGLEYQFDYAWMSLYGRFRVNSFDTVNQRLPEINFDVPRVELFKGLYYQSENQFTYNQMKFRDFDIKGRYGELSNYDAARFDTMHFFYYPISLSFLNIVPRAGFRVTAWSDTSKNDVSDEDLGRMFAADSLQGTYPALPFVQFRTGGGSQVRFMAEFGVDVNTKIYRTWNNVRSSWFELDGLRHVLIPFVNYTFIPDPTGNTDKILYFDNIDRLSRQNYFRIGMTNRLETRSGDFGSESIRRWGEFTTYFDYHLQNADGFHNLGDLAMLLNLTPTKGLTLTAEAVIDIGNNNHHDYQVTRNGRDAGNPGLSGLKALNRLKLGFSYQFNEDLKITFDYDYQDQYVARATYAMGSTMDTITCMAYGMNSLYTRSQTLNSSLSFPTYIDPTLKGVFTISYDVDAALLKSFSLGLIKQFHCFDLGFAAGRTRERDSNGDMDDTFTFSGFVQLHAMPGMGYNMRME